jgi:SlyX protein
MKDRISELESRVAFQEQMIDELNDVIARQDQILMDLSQVVKMLNQKVNTGQHDEIITEGVEPPPPHY